MEISRVENFFTSKYRAALLRRGNLGVWVVVVFLLLCLFIYLSGLGGFLFVFLLPLALTKKMTDAV